MTSELIPTAAELKLIEAAAKGVAADYRAVGAPQDDWQHNQDESKTLRAEIVRALVSRTEPAWPLSGTALRIVGARITGAPNLTEVETDFALSFEACCFEESIELTGAKI